MTENTHRIARIIISMDSAALDSLHIESAVSLAARLQAELCGLYIEDIALLQLADLPFTREITLHTAVARELSSESVARRFKAMGSHLRHKLEALAKIHRVVCTFRAVRGPQPEAVIEASGDYQLVMLLPRGKLTREARGRTVLSHRHPVVLLYDGSAQARSALSVIKALNDETLPKHLLVLNTAHSTQEEILDQIPSDIYRVEFVNIQDCNLATTISLAKQYSAGLLILPVQERLSQEKKETARLLGGLSFPVMMVR